MNLFPRFYLLLSLRLIIKFNQNKRRLLLFLNYRVTKNCRKEYLLLLEQEKEKLVRFKNESQATEEVDRTEDYSCTKK
jgi:hypothetical protein